MKAVVLAVKKKKAAVMLKNGELKYIKDRGYTVGQIMPVDEPVSGMTVIKRGNTGFLNNITGHASSIAAAATVILLTGAVTSYAAPVSTVTLDFGSNPSLSMDVNLYNRIIGFSSKNEDAEKMMSGAASDLMGKDIRYAAFEILDRAKESKYIDNESVPVIGTVDTHNRRFLEDRLARELDSTMSEWNSRQDIPVISYEISPVTDELRSRSEKQGLPPGQMLLNERRASEVNIKPAPEDKTIPEKPDGPVTDTGTNDKSQHGGRNTKQSPAPAVPYDTRNTPAQNAPASEDPAIENPEFKNPEYEDPQPSADPYQQNIPSDPVPENPRPETQDGSDIMPLPDNDNNFNVPSLEYGSPEEETGNIRPDRPEGEADNPRPDEPGERDPHEGEPHDERQDGGDERHVDGNDRHGDGGEHRGHGGPGGPG
ncbi:MAG: hypothetical protein K5886_13390 [Lachnospiraceae bacterium]|nr:hypothetical protein [Lachnospiraceae bacterium]